MICRVITCFIEYYNLAWTDDNDKKTSCRDHHHITLEKLQEEIGDKKEISLFIEGDIPAHMPDKLSQCVKRLRLGHVSMTDKHCVSTW